MSYIIGLDAHSSTSEFAVYKDSNKLVKCQSLKTSAKEFIDFVKSFPSPRIVIFEESTLSAWLLSVFKPYCEDIVICDPYANNLISKSDQKSDKLDCQRLVELYRLNMLKRVYHGAPDQEDLKQLVSQYHSYVQARTSTKNQIHAKYRQCGIFIKRGKSYSFSAHEPYIAQLNSDSMKHIIPGLLRVVEVQNNEVNETRKAMLELSMKHLVLSEFQRIPGVGPVTALTFFSIIITPKRFKTKEKLWSYCKIGISTKESGGKIFKQRLTKRGNPVLKNVLMNAALSGIRKKDSCLSEMYRRLIERGLSPALARVTVSRKITSTMYYIWLKGCSFDPKHIR